VQANRAVYWLGRHWLFVVNLGLAVFVGLPWLAPVFMKLGWAGAANIIYLLYSTQCHQLPQRSFFLFGAQPTYSLAEIQAVWQATVNPLVLRQFIGDAQMGWKVAWSDRMVAMFTSLLVFGVLYAPIRRWITPLPLWAFVFLLAPMALDGGTHLISDLAGLGQGFRDSNQWLATLTQHTFPAAFYAGDALGSFNSWMRLLTGMLFGLGVVWLAHPHLESVFAGAAREIEAKLHSAGVEL